MDDSSHLKQPKLELNTPDDVENMHAIREFITNRKAEQEGIQAMLKYEGLFWLEKVHFYQIYFQDNCWTAD